MFKTIIKRPVFATVISILLVILGLVGINSLPVTKFPDIAPPVVSVRTIYPGANAETIARSVAPPLENAINGVENMDYITSTASNDGSLSISVIFKVGTDPDQAAINVQNRVAQVTNQLPAEVNQAGITTTKIQNSMIAIISLTSDNGQYDETFLQNYLKINIVPEIKRLKGVGDVQVWGGKDYSMRVWLDPAKLNAYQLTPQEISGAIQAQNIEAAPGKFGEFSDEAKEFVMRYKGKYTELEEYENIVIRAQNDGSILKLKDVARIEFGAYDYSIISQFTGKPGISMGIFQLPGSNSNEVQIVIEKRMKELKKSFPVHLTYKIPFASKNALDQSIKQVITTLIEAFILVFFVVYIFLQDVRSTLIPAIAVPVSIIGTFFFMYLFGFSINILTLFALVLAIGIVVDDAIVVVEAVHAKMEHQKLKARAATMSAMSEITAPIISITLVMSAVFIPVAFMDGSSGLFYQQFALTLAIAIVISAINALTLSPALTALFLKSNQHEIEGKKAGFKTRFFNKFNLSFDKLTHTYGKSIHFLRRTKWIALIIFILFSFLFGWLYTKSAKGFIPDEDQSFIIAAVNLPPGSSRSKTIEVMNEMENYLVNHPATESVFTLKGFSLFSFTSSPSSGVCWIRLKPIKERGETQQLPLLLSELQNHLSKDKRGDFIVVNMPTIDGFGNTSGIELMIQDRTNNSLEKLGSVSYQLIGALMQNPEIAFAFTPFSVQFPQFELIIDQDKASQLGVSLKEITTVMQGYYGSIQSSDFNKYGQYYRVLVQSQFDLRKDPQTLNSIFVKNNQGEMVPITTMVTLKPTNGAEVVDRFNLYNSSAVTIMPKPGFSTGQVIEVIEKVSQQTLPNGYTIDFKGLSREEAGTSSKSSAIFSLCILFVYFLLSAQYESYILPLAILLAIPMGLSGVFIGIYFFGIDNNIYVQIALVMLIGLLAKNGILIVEFALQRRKIGLSLLESAIEGAKARLRPILMTSIAFIVGLIPLVFVVGPSAMGNHSIGYAAISGMFIGTVLGLFITPILFIVFQYLQEKVSSKKIPDSEWEY